jgi:hypothetical protein
MLYYKHYSPLRENTFFFFFPSFLLTQNELKTRGFIVILPYFYIMYFDQIHTSIKLSYPSPPIYKIF